MDIFGQGWEDHPTRIERGWTTTVTEDDLVLVPGDISWAMRLNEAEADLKFIGSLPGKTVIIRGNHDYWWSSLKKIRQILPDSIYALQNDHYPLPDGGAVCGCRGWEYTDDKHDQKIYKRELQRLKLSFDSAKKSGLVPRIVMMHYPPITKNLLETPFSKLLEKYRISICVFGHLHGEAQNQAVRGPHKGVTYKLVACDFTGFNPVHLLTL